MDQTSEFFTSAFRKKRVRRAPNHDNHALPDHLAPAPRVSLQIANAAQEEAADVADREPSWQRLAGAEPLLPKHRSACFEKALFDTLPPSELPPAQVRLVLPPVDSVSDKKGQHKHLQKPDGGSAICGKLCGQFKFGSKNFDTALKLGRQIAKLESDPAELQRFTWSLQQRARPPVFSCPRRGMTFNRLNLSNLLPDNARRAHTERSEKKQQHRRDVLERMQTSRAALDLANRTRVEAKQAKIRAMLSAKANEQQLQKQTAAALLMAFSSRTQCLLQRLLKSRENRHWEAKQLWAAVILQRQMRKFVAWRLTERMHNAARTIIRYVRRWQIRKMLRNRRRAAFAICSFAISKQRGQDTSFRVRVVMASVRKVQRIARTHQMMWKARTRLHRTHWDRMEPAILLDLVAMRSGSKAKSLADVSDDELGSIPRRIPRHVQAAVLARFVSKARDEHVKRCVDYNASKAFFLQFKAKEAEGATSLHPPGTLPAPSCRSTAPVCLL